jgi:hypothetical protein
MRSQGGSDNACNVTRAPEARVAVPVVQLESVLGHMLGGRDVESAGLAVACTEGRVGRRLSAVALERCRDGQCLQHEMCELTVCGERGCSSRR